MRPRLAVLSHPRGHHPVDVRQAIGPDIELLWVVSDPQGERPEVRHLLGRLGTVVAADGIDLDTMTARLEAHRPDGIVSFVDDHLVLAAELAARLDLTFHTSSVAANLVSKPLQRSALSRAKVPGPRFWIIPANSTHRELAEMAEQIEYPAVLKPPAGSGSRGMRMLAGPDAVVAMHPLAADHLVESYLEDDPERDRRFASYLSVESLVCHGRVTHVTTSGRFAIAEAFRETGNFVPATVTGAQRDAVADLAYAAIRALDITTGVLHTEIKLTPDGPKLIEVNGRLGARPPFLLRKVSEVNLFRTAAELALGWEVDAAAFAETRGIAYWRMFQPPLAARRVRAVHGLDKLAAASHVSSVRLRAGPGDQVDWREGTDGQVLSVLGRVGGFAELEKAIAFIDAAAQIEYEPGDEG